jgi:hypothetical protein
MDRAEQSQRDRKFLLILLLTVVPFAALMTLLLTSIFGPSDLGVRCLRPPGREARCEVLQSRLLGFAGNSAVPILESDIAGAGAVCAARSIGGRAGPSCTVNLLLKSGPYRSYPVLSYPLLDQAQSSARKLNAYFADPSRRSILLQDELGGTLLMAGGLPLLTVAVVLALRWRRRTAACPTPSAQ